MNVSLIRTTLLLLTLTILIPISIAQGNVVKVIYFYPNDRTPQTGINTTLDGKVKEAQAFFAAVLKLYGYNEKKFPIETDSEGNLVVHHVKGDNNDAYYKVDPFSRVVDELNEDYTSSDDIYYVCIDIDSNVLDVNLYGTDFEACGVASSNWCATPARGGCFSYAVIAHELGHTFGLDHDVHSTGSIDRMINSPCSAAWINLHPFFNGGNTDSGPTTIVEHEPTFSDVPGRVRFSFNVNDPDGLFIARVFVYEQDTVVGCKQFDENVDGTVIFNTSYIPQENKTASLSIMDRKGNYTEYVFDLITADLLGNLLHVDISDVYLDDIIREQLNLQSDVQLTDRMLLSLTSLNLTDVNRQIRNLTGLEYAQNLDTLRIRNQQFITDFSPLSNLTNLSTLEISGCGLFDLSILSALTNLQHLNIADNAIQDISVLSGLTSLITLDLSNNQISDVSPLTALTNLQWLSIQGNPIDDTSPLLTVLEQNPDLEIIFNDEPTFIEGENAKRWVVEKSPIGTKIGSAITATDNDGDPLTYTISSFGDTGVFDIDSNNGQLRTKTILDYNIQNKYSIEVYVSDGTGASDSISVDIYVAPAGGGVILTELLDVRVSFSELMYTSRGGIHSLSQWMELYNGSQTEQVNLKGWQIAIEARDLNGRHRHAIIPLKEFNIPAQETGLIVTWHARQKSDLISEDKVYYFFNNHFDEFEQNQHRNMIIGLAGFSMKLMNTEGLLVDIIGNLDGDPSTRDEPAWEMPTGTTNNGYRTSLMRRYEKETLAPLDGTAANSWRRSSDFPLVVSTHWGNARDIGNPGYRTRGTLPVTLSHFNAVLGEKGAVLSWTTESEIENAGFYVLRSDTREGAFKIINQTLIQGAGTTGQRNDYTWTDTTIKADTRYYYRLVDVSFAGIQEELATVGLQGLISAGNKQLTKWGDLKQ